MMDCDDTDFSNLDPGVAAMLFQQLLLDNGAQIRDDIVLRSHFRYGKC